LSRPQTTALFRIFQETLTNVARHSAATNVLVTLTPEDDGVRLQVEDDGRGFDLEQVAARRSLGILGMRERAEMLGGRFEIRGVEGRGTTVVVKMPQQAPEEESIS
jgi:signal transduction histidine kinase